MLCGMGVFGAYAENMPDDLIKGSVKLRTPDGSDQPIVTYYYSDDYFRGSGKTDNEHLRTMSAIAAFYITGDSQQPVEEYSGLLRSFGYKNIVAYDLELRAKDSIGTLLACKTIDGVPVIAVELRGDDYADEWASNFLAGLSGDMSGFSDAAQKVIDRIQAYLYQMGMKKAKFWITGYSRAGAVANLVGRELNEHPDLYETTADDIYVYTFEAPKCTDEPIAYENIHNIVDSSDIITMLYPGIWPAGRNGVDIEIGDAEETFMTKQFVIEEPYIIDYKETELTPFISEFADLVGNNVDRTTYADQVEEHLSSLAEMYFSLSDDEQSSLLAFFTKVGENIQNDLRFKLVVFGILLNATSEATIKSVIALITDNINLAVEEVGKPVGDEDFAVITEAVPALIRAFMPVVKADVSRWKTDENGYATNISMYYLTSFFANIKDIVSHHFNYNVFKKLEALDSYYAKRADVLLGDTDGNGKVDIVDATLIQRFDTNLCTLDEAAQMRSDINKDGSANIIDATFIQRYATLLPAPDGIGKPI